MNETSIIMTRKPMCYMSLSVAASTLPGSSWPTIYCSAWILVKQEEHNHEQWV